MRPPIKSTKKLEIAKIEAKYKAELKEPATLWLKDRAANVIDNIDPLETAAIAGLTVMIHNTILANADLFTAAADLLEKALVTGYASAKGFEYWLKYFTIGPLVKP